MKGHTATKLTIELNSDFDGDFNLSTDDGRSEDRCTASEALWVAAMFLAGKRTGLRTDEERKSHRAALSGGGGA